MRKALILSFCIICSAVILNAQNIKETNVVSAGYTYLGKAEKGGLYLNTIITTEKDWGFITNFDFYFVNKATFTFMDIGVLYTLLNENVKLYPYSGLALAFYDDGNTGNELTPQLAALGIDAFKMGISLGIGGTILIENIALPALYGYYSPIKSSMFRIAIGIKF